MASSRELDRRSYPASLRAFGSWLLGWWQVLDFAAKVLVLAASPSSYRASQRRLMLDRIYRATWPMLPSFTLLTAIFALVLIRIVLTAAYSYGLTRYALAVLIRTLMIELIPLSAALYVAVRYSLADGERVRAMRAAGRFNELQRAGRDALRDVVLPRVLAGQFAVVALALVSGAVVLVLAYLSLYGFASWGFHDFTRSVGQVLDPLTVVVLVLKTFLMSLAVAIIPMMTIAGDRKNVAASGHSDLAQLARLLFLILAIEILALVGSYI